ncbi:MAG: ABC transporter ATP-binding protein [Firmicutes bacterium]|jgi:iron complex transport system ATP-binding protein|nr:ABC transporter ATP-binding protein [Bacillota bacterium]
MLKVQGLSFYYHRDKEVLKDISFQLDRHDILCLLGPNGTGKTTMLRCLLSLNKIKNGTIEIDGVDFTKATVRERAEMVAYVPQATAMAFSYESFEVVLMGRIAHLPTGGKPTAKDKAIAYEVMEKLGITHLIHKDFNQMSGGEKQMILVARALVQQSRILVMDEPTANLDYSNQVKILQVIKDLAEEGYAILMASHFPNHAFLACNKVALMRDGVIMAQGNPEDIVTTENLTRLYQTPVCVTEAELNFKRSVTKVCVPVMG